MDMEKINILSNIGSASKKYSVYSNDIEIAWFHIEKQNTGHVVSYKVEHAFEKKNITEEQYLHAIRYVIQVLVDYQVIKNNNDIESIGLRVVVPHEDFRKDTICTEEIIEKLKEFRIMDPIHIDPVLEEIQNIEEFISKDTKICIISDSAFHETAKKQVALPFKTDVYTIGYHGLSCESVLSILKEYGIQHKKLLSVHLGSGSSVTAIRNNISIYNSMDFSPLNGILMSSRVGSIDPFLVLLYMKENNLSYEEVLKHLYKNSGLLSMSNGLSNDLRVIREHAFAGDSVAKQTIMHLVDSISAEISKAISYTQGVDTIVFTGTIGYRAHYIREMVIEKLSWLGCVIEHTNNIESHDICFEISTHNSKIKIYVIQIDEMKEMHRHMKNIFKK